MPSPRRRALHRWWNLQPSSRPDNEVTSVASSCPAPRAPTATAINAPTAATSQHMCATSRQAVQKKAFKSHAFALKHSKYMQKARSKRGCAAGTGPLGRLRNSEWAPFGPRFRSQWAQFRNEHGFQKWALFLGLAPFGRGRGRRGREGGRDGNMKVRKIQKIEKCENLFLTFGKLHKVKRAQFPTYHLLRWPVLRRHALMDAAAAALDARCLQTSANRVATVHHGVPAMMPATSVVARRLITESTRVPHNVQFERCETKLQRQATQTSLRAAWSPRVARHHLALRAPQLAQPPLCRSLSHPTVSAIFLMLMPWVAIFSMAKSSSAERAISHANCW